jgi:hypothetical protein
MLWIDKSVKPDYLECCESELPGVYASEYAWISPAGDWYSCGYGGHEIKARLLVLHLKLDEQIRSFTETLEKGTVWEQLRNLGASNDLTMHAMAFLIDAGWARIHDSGNDGYLQIHSKDGINAAQAQAYKWMMGQFDFILNREANDFNGYQLAFKI